MSIALTIDSPSVFPSTPILPPKGGGVGLSPNDKPTHLDIERWLGVFLRPNQVVEARLVGVVDNPKYPAHILSGYYTRDRLGSMSIDVWNNMFKAEGTFFTFNAVDPELLTRSCNRLKKAKGKTKETDGDPLTADTEIIKRNWILIDCDAARISKTSGRPLTGKLSASRAEKNAAFDRMAQVSGYLEESGFPEMIDCDSGNGAHKWVAWDLPLEDDHLVKLFLHGLDRKFSDERVSVDTKVCNLSRIVKIYGSVVRKGDHTEDRPHRYSRVLHIPDEIIPVDRGLIEKVIKDNPSPVMIAMAPAPVRPPTSGAETRRANPSEKLRRASAFMAAKPPTVCGRQECQNRAFDGACDLIKGFDLTIDEARPDFVKWLNLNLVHIWSEREIEHKLEEADKKADDKPRGYHLLKETGFKQVQVNSVHPTTKLIAIAKKRIECSDVSLSHVTESSLSCLEAINDPPENFDCGGKISWVKVDQEDGRAFIQGMDKYAIRNRLSEAAAFTQTTETKKGPIVREVFPPMDIVHGVMSQKKWTTKVAPPLDLVAESPRFLRGGKIILSPGYHPDGRIFYHPPESLLELNPPKDATDQEIAEAVDLLANQYLGDFPFAEKSSRANAMACMLLPFVRLMIDGPTPLHLFEASTEGTGKGLCARACAYPSLGRSLGSRPQKEDEAEWRKSLTSALRTGGSHIYWDNMYNPVSWDGTMRPIDSGTLAAFFTENVWEDRILGGSKDAIIKIRAVLMASGNNLEWSKELNRRITPIRLRTPQENPSERTGFRCAPDTLDQWAMKNRLKLLEACLTICNNWIAKGMKNGKQVFGSYESYAQVMGGILDSAGIEGFLGNLKVKTVNPIDRESIRWNGLVNQWISTYPTKPVTSGEIYEIIHGDTDIAGSGLIELQVAFADVLGDGTPLSRKQKLGNALMKQVDRVWSGKRIVISSIKGLGGTNTYALSDPEINDEI